jgi:hypothetical protein
MVFGAIVNLILVIFYLLLAYITFKELSKRKSEESTHQRILLKWMTAAVFFSSFWVIEYVLYFIPTFIIKLPLGLWIMMPQFYGEYTIFNMISDLFEHLEYYFRFVRNSLSSGMFGATFSLCISSFSIIKKFIPTDRLKDFQNEIRKLDKEMNDELRLRKLIRMNMSGGTPGGYNTPGGHFDQTRDRRDTTIMNPDQQRNRNPVYYKPPTGQIYTPVGMHTRAPLVTSTSESIKEVDELNFANNVKKSRTSVKSSKHSRQSSKERSINKLANVGHSSSYIDPKLLNRQTSDKGLEEYQPRKSGKSKKFD